MREVLTDFVQAVRAEGLRISVSESIDAVRAAAVVGIDERETFRDALAAVLVKDEADRATFDDVFDRFFSSRGGAIRKRERRRAGEPGGRLSSPDGDAEGGAGRVPPTGEERRPGRRPAVEPKRTGDETRREELRPAVRRHRRRKELLEKPFRQMDPLEAEELPDLARALARRFRARLRRRLRRGGRERPDFRRTFRKSVSRGGVPIELAFRRRRPGRPDLVALCDVSGSARYATEFFASLLVPMQEFFRRVTLLVYVDRPVEASVENGHIAPEAPLDMHAYSDLGAVLREVTGRYRSRLDRNTVLLVLGDGRNNRRPHRADLVKSFRNDVRALWWLAPEGRESWGAGDSDLPSYCPACDEMLPCANARELVDALVRMTR